VVVNPNGSAVYVESYGYSPGAGTVSVINTATNTVTATIVQSASLGSWVAQAMVVA
jgi:YVTN family beta-propeller protein